MKCVVAYIGAAGLLLACSSRSDAQVIPSTKLLTEPPWNAQRVFEPSPLPELADRDSSDEIPPEDMPVMKRQQPGYDYPAT